MYIRLHACTYTIHSTQTHICIYTHTTQRLDAPEHTHMDNDSMCLHACIYISTCMYVDTCTCILTYVYAHAYMYIGHVLSVDIYRSTYMYVYEHTNMYIYSPFPLTRRWPLPYYNGGYKRAYYFYCHMTGCSRLYGMYHMTGRRRL